MRLDQEMLQFVLNNEGFSRWIETTNNGGGDGGADPGPGKDIGGGLLELPSKFLNQAVGFDNFDETLHTFKLLQDEFSQGVRWCGGDLADDGGREVVGDVIYLNSSSVN